MGPLRQRKNSVFHNIIEQQYDQSIKYKLYNSVKGNYIFLENYIIIIY